MKPLNYDDICLIPDNYSELNSRDEADTSVRFLGFKFKNPVILANMQSVVNTGICRSLDMNNYFYIMHRFGGPDEMPNFRMDTKFVMAETVTQCLIQNANIEDWKVISISTGVNDDTKADLEWAKANGYRIDFVTIDIALGYHKKVAERIKFIKKEFPNAKVIAGNIVGPNAMKFLRDAGADAVKCGIGGGSPCSTKFQTGFTAPMVWTIDQCYESGVDLPIIADGGIKYIGDIAKAIRFGAKMVMCGGLFASCINSAAKINKDGKKEYFGSASFNCKKHDRHIEGFQLNLEADKTILEKMDEVNQALASSISYSGGDKLDSLIKIPYLILK